MSRAFLGWLFLVVACGCGGAPQDRFDPPTEVNTEKSSAPVVSVDRTTAPVAAVLPSTSEPVQVVLVWEGIAPLHKGFFSEPAFVRQLGRDLAGWVKPPVNVYVSFDSNRHIGRVQVRLLPDTGQGLLRTDDAKLDITAISPVLQALARYRGAVAQRFDTRVNAFHVGIESFRGAQYCRFGAAGTPPPDGTVVDRCVILNGVERCGTGPGESLVFSDAHRKQIESCLR